MTSIYITVAAMLLRYYSPQTAGEYSQVIGQNLYDLAKRVNTAVAQSGYSGRVDVLSGWRPPSVNRRIRGASPRSAHMSGQAVDLVDPDGRLARALSTTVLEANGLWMENPRHTRGWVHLTSRPAKHRVFEP